MSILEKQRSERKINPWKDKKQGGGQVDWFGAPPIESTVYIPFV